jgi:hypothetical protein
MERKNDKENSFNAEYVPRSKSPLPQNTPLTPNNSLRKKLEQNLANYEPLKDDDTFSGKIDMDENIEYDSRQNSSLLNGKRSSAKNRGFEMKVNSIDSIN